METENNPWKTLNQETAYENAWIRVEHHEVLNPAGNPGIYGKVHFKNTAISIVALDSEGFTYLVGQYRYTLNAYSWEVPEGGCSIESGEATLAAAKRELLEETGLVATEWTELGEVYLSNSVSDEKAVMYLAQNLSQHQACPEETEQLKIRKLPLKEAIEMAQNGQITDALSVLTLLKIPALHLL
ncbi:NUDIX domain-containing protein [Aquirufa sp. HETE-40SA]|jgi:8-oxo-dGTP pyrophosphatase MutT (NUDIX family)